MLRCSLPVILSLGLALPAAAADAVDFRAGDRRDGSKHPAPGDWLELAAHSRCLGVQPADRDQPPATWQA